MEHSPSKIKRLDLQGIRGIAIISVLAFHFLPTLFPNGYLGVDQFFVLSGFLMCMLLRRCSTSSFHLILEFYGKRMKRILPLYLLIILVSLLSIFYLFPKTAYETNMESAKRALLFVSNRAATQAEDYFEMLAIAIDIFTHTWSLSVEVQFYLIVPFIFLIGSHLLPDAMQKYYYALIDQAEKLNEDWSVNDYRNTFVPTCIYEDGQGPFDRCDHNTTGLAGKYKILIFGNSLAANHARLIYQECGSKAKGMPQIATKGCEPLYPSINYGGQRCIDAVEKFKKALPKEQPDYAFLMSRFLDIGEPLQNGVTRVEDDNIYKIMKTNLELFAESVQNKLYIFMQLPEIVPANVGEIVNILRNGEDLAEFDKSFVVRNHTFARMRYDRLISECDKCVPINYDSLFWNTTTNTWRFYDEANSGLSYVTTVKHFSFHGLELVRPIFKDVCNKIV